MGTQSQEQRTPADKTQRDIDETVKESFPASDPPAVGGATRVEAGGSAPAQHDPADNPDKPDPTQPERHPSRKGESAKEPGVGQEEDDSEAPPNESSTENGNS